MGYLQEKIQMKKCTTDIKDLVNQEIESCFFSNGKLVIATANNFAVFQGYDYRVSENLDLVNVRYMAIHGYGLDEYVKYNIITQEEINELKQEHELREKVIEDDRKRAKIRRDLVERDRLNKLYPLT